MVAANIKWIMLVSGLLTFSMIYGLIAPQQQLLSTFGETIEGPVANIVVRNWGALIAMVGAMLMFAAFHEPSRALAAGAAIGSKVVFISLILSMGSAYLEHQAGVAVVADSLMIVLFVAYLMARRR